MEFLRRPSGEGLGSAWTTAILSVERTSRLLGIPEGMTQIAMLPVAWMKGTDVRLAPRRPAREITYFDVLLRHGNQPQPEPAFEDGPGALWNGMRGATCLRMAVREDINFPSRTAQNLSAR